MGWHYKDLTNITGAPLAFALPTGYAFDAYGTRHVTYVGIDQHVHELWWNTGGWHHKDLTVAAGLPLEVAIRRLVTCSFARSM